MLLKSTIFTASVMFASSAMASSVLFLGDSQSHGPFGRHMYKFFLENASLENVHVYGVGSSSPRHWISSKEQRDGKWLCKRKGRFNSSQSASIKKHICKKSKPRESAFKYLVRTTSPNWVVFQFLGNSTGFSKEFIQKRLKEVMQALPEKSRCAFITSPPHYISKEKANVKRERVQGYFAEVISERCLFIPGVTQETLQGFAANSKNFWPDKMHMSELGAKRFFEYVKVPLEKVIKTL